MASCASSADPQTTVLAADPELQIDLRNVLLKLDPHSKPRDFSSKKWCQLGIQLSVPENKLEEFSANHKDDPDKVFHCLSDTIKYWIKNGEVTWKVLWEALCHESVAHINLGIEIRDWYLEKTWNDPRKKSTKKRTYIQLPGGNRQLQSVKCKLEDTGFSSVSDSRSKAAYFRIEPVQRQRSPPNSIYPGHMKGIISQLKKHLKTIEPHQKKFKVGYEARFGQLYWKLPEASVITADVQFWFDKEPQRFSTHITCDIGKLTRDKCYPPKEEHRSILLDPLKFVVDLPAHRGVVYVAVVSQDQDGKFELHDVYQQQKKQLRTTFDIVQPQRKYDFRLGDCCALTCKADDEVWLIADGIKRSIHIDDEGKLSMELVGEYYHVTFLRHKEQQVYRWKGKEEQKWYLAEYDVTEYDIEVDLTEEKLQTIRAKASRSAGRWTCDYRELPVGKHKKEIELWSRKIFPERYSYSHPTSRMYIEPEATGPVRMPYRSAKPATEWKAEELLEDIDEFVQAAFDITSYLEHP